MFARYHGEPATQSVAKSLPKAPALAGPSVRFMFEEVAKDPANRLPDGAATIAALRKLGASMAQDPSNEESRIPAAYTYFGQFIDHDITKTAIDPSISGPNESDVLLQDDFRPIPLAEIGQFVTNMRSPVLDLDSVYEGLAELAQEPDGKMVLGEVSPSGFGPIVTADKLHDLPRRPLIQNPTPDQLEADRQALIGDPRNDENLLVAQLHVGILRSHNALMRRGLDKEAARTAIRRRYQWAALHDFLPRICDPAVVGDVVRNGPRFWKAGAPAELFMPLEFSAAAYRFGHSMIRAEYSHNATFSPEGPARATFNFLFTFTALSGDISPGAGPSSQFPTLPDNWIIEWPRFFSPKGAPGEAGLNPARRIDTRLTPDLGELRDIVGRPVSGVLGQLAARNLLRGYLLGLPTGQAIARHIGVTPLDANTIAAAVLPAARADIEKAGLLQQTPLWFYILAEAGDAAGPNGQHLGPVGSRIVAETFWNLIRHARDSVIADPPTEKELQSGEFTLKGLIRIGQDTGMEPLPPDAAPATSS